MEMFIYSLPIKDNIYQYSTIEQAITKASLESMIKVDLLTIAIGPEHHELPLVNIACNNIIGRISFNVICNHIESVIIKLKQVNITIFQIIQNEVVIKLKIHDSHNSLETNKTEKIKSICNLVEVNSFYNWVEPVNKISPLELLLELSMNELTNSGFYINIYEHRINPEDDFVYNSEKEYFLAHFKQYGSANINLYNILSDNNDSIQKQSSAFFNKFFTKETERKNEVNNNNNNNTQMFDQHVIKCQIIENLQHSFNEDILINGECLGKMEGILVVENIPLIRQIMCGVHTENGFDINTVQLNINNEDKTMKSDSFPVELKALILQTQNLMHNFIKETNLVQRSTSNKDFNTQQMQLMTEIKKTLQKSSKESVLYYNYQKNLELYFSQKIILDFGLDLLNLIESFTIDQRIIAFDLLTLINNRAEFDLGTLWKAWFIVNDDNSFRFRDDYLINQKVIETFILFNNSCLEFVLERLSRKKYIDKHSKTFVEFFLSVAYFKIPLFKKEFLRIISIENQEEYERRSLIEEVGFNPNNNQIDLFLNIDPINSLVLWENLFYKRLEDALVNNKIDNEIKDKLKNTELIMKKTDEENGIILWKQRLAKRGLAYISIIEKIEKYINSKVVKKTDIKWKNVIGFDLIIESLINELKSKEILSYSKELINLLMIFINDIDIINKFTYTILSKTK